MYEQVSHSLLNRILDRLNPEIRKRDLRHFYTRLGANFYAIYSLFHHLYGRRDDFQHQMQRLVEVMARRYIERRGDVPRQEGTGRTDAATGMRHRLHAVRARTAADHGLSGRHEPL